jgi:hypothetical protein
MPRKIIRRTRPAVDETVPLAAIPAEPIPEIVREIKKPYQIKALPIIVVLLVGCVGVACLKYVSVSNKGATKAAAATTEQQVSDLVAQVSKHIVVPAGQTPMVATVQDPELLRTQNALFYKDAQVGDRLLVWSDKAVLYSPSRDLVLAMAPLAGNVAASSTMVQPKNKPTVELRNGSGTVGLAAKAADKFKAAGLNVVAVTSAKSKEVKASEILVTHNKDFGTIPADLAKLTKGSVVNSIAGEPGSTADILVIIGSDYRP